MSNEMVAGDTLILRGQRRGRLHLEGGLVMQVEGEAIVLTCDGRVWVMGKDELEPLTVEYLTIKGNFIVPMEGAQYASSDTPGLKKCEMCAAGGIVEVVDDGVAEDYSCPDCKGVGWKSMS